MRSALAGVLLFLAFLPHQAFAPLVWVALVPWFLEVEPHEPASDWVRAGAVLFAVFWALNVSWILLLVPRLGVLWPVPAYLGQLLVLTLLGAAFGAGIWALRRISGLPLAGAAAVAWVAVEWGRANLLGPIRFPWSPLALPLTAWRPLIQPAAWLGESALALGVVLVNGLLAATWIRVSEHRRRGSAGSNGPGSESARGPGAVLPGALAVGLVTVWWAGGALRMGAAEAGPVVRAVAVQSGIPLEARRGAGRAWTRTRTVTDSLLGQLPTRGMEVVVFPETHLLGPLPHGPSPHPTEATDWLAGWAEVLGAELLVGARTAVPGGMENALLRMTGDGVGERYGKVALVPGVEWGGGAGLVAGQTPSPLGAPGKPGPLICIESAWSGVARRHARGGAGWLVNVTNDGWLAGEALWSRTHAFRQHPRHLVLRSVETGLGALRVGTTGLTGVVSPTGAWTPLLPPHGAGTTDTTVDRLEGTTLFTRVGPLLGPALTAFTLLVGLLALGRRRASAPR